MAARVAETVLGKALKGIPRDRYYLSTKVGKYTNPGSYGDDTLDYSRARIRASLDESARAARHGLLRHHPPPRHRVPASPAHRVGAERGLGRRCMELKREGRIGA